MKKIIKEDVRLYHFKINEDIRKLKIDNIKSNLFNYSYTTKTIKKLILNNEPTTSDTFIASYTSFKGEVFENIIYEHLINYAFKEDKIRHFILKGPYQNQLKKYYKSGLMLDNSEQIVYKSAYKDISEYDAIFFTDDSIYFVEMSTSKKTDSLIKRLDKKSALLKMLFPKLNIRALIVLTNGAKGVSKFPSYCTVWITKDLEDDEFLHKIIFNKKEKKLLYVQNSKKFIQTHKVRYEKFQYFQTLEKILNNSRSKKDLILDLEYFKSKQMSIYFDIFTKLYVGYILEDEFINIFPEYNLEAREQKVVVTIEKINTKLYDFVYYVKEKNGKLKRIYLAKNGEIKIKDKELDGFTNAEVRFLYNILEPEHTFTATQLTYLREKNNDRRNFNK